MATPRRATQAASEELLRGFTTCRAETAMAKRPVAASARVAVLVAIAEAGTAAHAVDSAAVTAASTVVALALAVEVDFTAAVGEDASPSHAQQICNNSLLLCGLLLF